MSAYQEYDFKIPQAKTTAVSQYWYYKLWYHDIPFIHTLIWNYSITKYLIFPHNYPQSWYTHTFLFSQQYPNIEPTARILMSYVVPSSFHASLHSSPWKWKINPTTFVVYSCGSYMQMKKWEKETKQKKETIVDVI